ncbi:MAG: amidohydrolase/deacetylase family metallohydrolase [Gemmatimonadetes bacterium]|nr:amidohydrolase/deacetylase family metallohydrolase [Gemmatimonadota bacterium]MYD24677.1 amidohydrolase/deacetylase family metallohydrolase [Gemmatimonadota bacterium]MYI98160.1 amidohydrolase/deacetylase family metallohydrolase [Gemmatimonadota bacterium]
MYDLIIKGGHVIDPENGISGSRDVAVDGGLIAAVEHDIPAEHGRKVARVHGHYVTPGLLDIHMHAYGGYRGWVFPDAHVLPNGVTTVLDTGGAGWRKFEDFKDTVIADSTTRVLALINIVGAGMEGAVEQDVSEMDPVPCGDMISRYPEHVVGSKTAHFGGPGWEAVDGAVEAARRSGTIAMIDFAPKPTRSYRDLLLKKLSPGDIHTHLYAQHIPLLDEHGRVNDYVREARDKGILFDLGHGGGSFWFRIAVPAIEQGFLPDTISTDLHKYSALMPNASMNTTMSKCLNMGMTLEDVIMRSTRNPARAIRRPELGTLSIGAEADVAVLELEYGEFGFVDSGHARMRGDRRLRCLLTVRAGEVVWDLNGLTRPDWDKAGKYIRTE